MLYVGIISLCLSYFGKKSQSLFSQNPIFPILLYRKPHFLIFVRVHVIMTSQKPNAGHVGTYFGIGDSKLTIGTKMSIIRGVILKI